MEERSRLPGLEVDESRTPRRRRVVSAILWIIFTMGLLVRLAEPPLKIENNAFVILQSLVSNGSSIRPGEIVARERRLRAWSAVLTLTGALSLAFHYRRVLVRPMSS